MWVGLGTGTTVAELVPPLGARRLDITCVATSPATEELAVAHGLDVRPFTDIDRLDLAIDGADQVDPVGWLVKGGGGAHTRERIVAAAADRFVVIVSSDKPVDRLHPPGPARAPGLRAGGHPARAARARCCATRRRRPTAACSPTTTATVDDPADAGRRARRRAGRRLPRPVPARPWCRTVLIARGDEVETAPRSA